MARLYREAPVNSIWEGSGNVMCLDLLRALEREPDLSDILCMALLKDCADDVLLKESATRLLDVLSGGVDAREPAARYIAQELVLLTQASLMRQNAPQAVADAFVRTRFGAARATSVFATSATQATSDHVLERAWP
jgi:putative acyl-CoA dehydrogenase